MSFKVQMILVLVFYKNVLTNSLPQLNGLLKVPPRLSLYRYEGNFYPVFASNASKPNELDGNTKPTGYTGYLHPVHLNHQIYHLAEYENQIPRVDDATGSEYQVAMKVQPLQQVISSGKPQQHMEESGRSEAKRRLKIDTIMSPEKMYRLRNSRNRFYNHKSNELRSESVPKVGSVSVTRHYHDIFLKYKSPQELIFGHVLSWPEVALKRLEKRDKNHFKGQVIWADKTGGYGEQYWDLAHGAL